MAGLFLYLCLNIDLNMDILPYCIGLVIVLGFVVTPLVYLLYLIILISRVQYYSIYHRNNRFD